jgi:hypothetical protein
LTLIDVRRIAAEVATQQHLAVEVVAAIPAEGGSLYTEVLFSFRDYRVEPKRLVIGVNRNASEGECRGVVSGRVRQYLEEHLSDVPH